MAALGHPILGDAFYGLDNRTAETETVSYAVSEVTPLSAYDRAPRLLLHAEELQLNHPTTTERLKFSSPCPFQLADYDSILH